MTTLADKNAALDSRANPLVPAAAIVLGSGLGDFAEAVEGAVDDSLRRAEGFPAPSVSGHAGALVVGSLAGTPVAVMAGRGHYYEHGQRRRDARRARDAEGARRRRPHPDQRRRQPAARTFRPAR